jgi:hypothetical protein
LVGEWHAALAGQVLSLSGGSMLTKRLTFALLFMLAVSTVALAQKADVAFVVGGSFVSDSNVVFAVPCLVPPCPATPTFLNNVKTDHHVFLEGALAVQLLNARIASLHVELPVAGIPSQTLRISTATSPSTFFDHMSTTFVTPGLKLKLLPGSPISPFVMAGGGWAHFSLTHGTTNKGAVQYGGGIDLKTGIPHLGFRGEVRDFVTGDPNFGLATVIAGGLSGKSIDTGLHRHNILAGGGIVLRF